MIVMFTASCFRGQQLLYNGDNLCFSYHLHCLLQDRKGVEVRIFFYLDNNKSEPYFQWCQLDRGNFLCLEHAYIHTFLDGTTGIRVDDACDVSIIGD